MESCSASVRKARRREWWKKKKTDLRNKRDKMAAGKSSGTTTVARRKRTVEKKPIAADPKRGFRSTVAVPKTDKVSEEDRLSLENKLLSSSESDDDLSEEIRMPAQKFSNKEKIEKSKIKLLSSEQPKKDRCKKEKVGDVGKEEKVGDSGKKEKVGDHGKKEPVSDSGKKRYLLFLGNLPHEASHDDIIEHFSKRGVPIIDLRLLTDKESGKSKGCAFAEFSSSRAMQNAIKFHRSKLQGRTINVEVTCGGGGKGDKRQEKIRERNKTMRRTKTVKSGKVFKVTTDKSYKKAGNVK